MNKLVKLLIVAAFFNALAWMILIPVWQYPDEQAHFAQVQDVAEFGRRPTGKVPNTSKEIELSEKILQTERDEFGNNKFTYHPEYKISYSDNIFGPREQELLSLPKETRSDLVKKEATFNPPAYYFLGSLAYKLASSGSLFTRVYAVRLVSLLIFIALIFTTYQIAKIVFTEKPIYQIALTALVAFKPMLVFASTGILPDPLTNLLFSLVILVCLKIITEGIKPKYLILTAVLVILGSLTRQQFFISAPISLAVIAYQLITNPKQAKIAFLILLPSAFVIALMSPFIKHLSVLRNFSLIEAGKINLESFFRPEFFQFLSFTLKHTYSEVLPWYWGIYRWLSFSVPDINYEIMNRIIAIALVGIVIWVISLSKTRRLTKQDIVIIYLVLASLFYFTVFLIWDYFFYLGHGFSFGIQGRYFFPLVIAHLSILLFGIVKIVQLVKSKLTGYIILLVVVLMIIFNNASLYYVSLSYYDTSSVGTFISQASQYKPMVFKGNIIAVIIVISLVFQLAFLEQFARLALKKSK